MRTTYTDGTLTSEDLDDWTSGRFKAAVVWREDDYDGIRARWPVAYRVGETMLADEASIARAGVEDAAQSWWRTLGEDAQRAVRVGRLAYGQGPVPMAEVMTVLELHGEGLPPRLPSWYMRGRVRPADGQWVADQGWGSSMRTIGAYETPELAERALREAIELARDDLALSIAEVPTVAALGAARERWDGPSIEVWATSGQRIASGRVYGIAEIALALRIPRNTVSQWHRRAKIPPPSLVLAMGPLWSAEVIEPWIAEQRGDRPA